MTTQDFREKYPKKTKIEIIEEIQKSTEHWNNYANSKNMLYNSKFIKTFKQPESGYAEWLVSKVYNGNLQYRSNNKYFDITCEDKIIEVKSISRQRTIDNSYKITDEDKRNNIATHFAFVYFKDLIPEIIILIKISIIKEHSKKHLTLSELKSNSEDIYNLSCFFNT